MTLKNNLITRFKSIAGSIGAIVITVFLYTPTYDWLEKIFGVGAKINSYLAGAIVAVVYTFILAIVVDPILSLWRAGVIVEDKLVWTKDGSEIEVLEYLIDENFEDSMYPVSITIKCSPKRMWLFSLLKFFGFGILLYGSGNNLGFTKANGRDSQRYRVLNNKQIFINSFYIASKEERGNTWNIKFDIKLLDPATQESYIYIGFGFGTKKHKIKSRGLLMKIVGKPLTIKVVGSTGND